MNTYSPAFVDTFHLMLEQVRHGQQLISLSHV
jgi:hypothetical protein